MVIFESKDILYFVIEVLFIVDEEIGMIGVLNLKGGIL